MVPLIWNYPVNYPISLMATDILNPDGRLEIQQTFGNRDSYEILCFSEEKIPVFVIHQNQKTSYTYIEDTLMISSSTYNTYIQSELIFNDSHQKRVINHKV